MMEARKNHTAAEATSQHIESVRQWVMSPEGQNAIVASLQRAYVLATQFCETERVTLESLHKPTTC